MLPRQRKQEARVAIKRVVYAKTATVEVGRTEHTVAASAIEDVLLVNGLVKPAVTIDLRAEASGLVEAVFVKDGERVKAGQELLRLDSRVAHTAVQEADANLKQAEMQQAAAEIDLDEDTLALRRKTLERTKELLAKGLVARIEQLKAAVERTRHTGAAEATPYGGGAFAPWVCGAGPSRGFATVIT